MRGWRRLKPCRQSRRNFLQTILQRGNRFLKQFRQRLLHKPFQLKQPKGPANEIKPLLNTNEQSTHRYQRLARAIIPVLRQGFHQSPRLNVVADDGISYLLPYAQFLYAEMISNPALEKEPDAPPEKMLICFAVAEVVGPGQRTQGGWNGRFRNMN